jgi:acetyl esterase/lipase
MPLIKCRYLRGRSNRFFMFCLLFFESFALANSSCRIDRSLSSDQTGDKMVICQSERLGVKVADVSEKKTTEGFTYQFYRDVRFLGNDRDETMDIYLPSQKSEQKHSAILVIHGGGWSGGSKNDLREIDISLTMVKAGYAVYNIDYKLAKYHVEDGKMVFPLDEYPWPQNIYDCKTAVRFMRKTQSAMNVDGKKIGVIGGSAGGHLSLLLGLSANAEELNDGGLYKKYSSSVKCVVNLYGIPDIRVWGGWMFGDKEAQKLASPVIYLSQKTPPILTIHGGKDKTVDVSQSENFIEILKDKEIEHEYILIPEAAHSFSLRPSQHNCSTDLRAIVRDFFDRHLK